MKGVHVGRRARGTRGGPGYGHDRTAAGPADLKTLLTAGLDLVGAAL
ncbi:hypothetical protein [Streptomyces coelicoflavus]